MSPKYSPQHSIFRCTGVKKYAHTTYTNNCSSIHVCMILGPFTTTKRYSSKGEGQFLTFTLCRFRQRLCSNLSPQSHRHTRACSTFCMKNVSYGFTSASVKVTLFAHSVLFAGNTPVHGESSRRCWGKGATRGLVHRGARGSVWLFRR